MRAHRSSPATPNRFLQGPVAPLLAILALGGCMAWHAVPGVPRDFQTGPAARAIRVHRPDGRTLVVRQPQVVNDTLHGMQYQGLDAGEVAIPLSDVTSVDVEQVDAARTVVFVAAAGAAAGLVIAAVANASGSSGSSTPPPSNPGGYGGGYGGYGSFSCPLVYSWDGQRWRLDSGTFGGAITRGLQRTDVDNLDFAAPQDGILRLRVADELEETDHLDALAVLAVDADPGLAVAPDPAGGLHAIGSLVAPLSARDDRGGDALARVHDADGWAWESSLSNRDTARAADLRDGLTLTFPRPHGAARAHLVLDGNSSRWSALLLDQFIRAHGTATQAWYDSLDARPAFARATGTRLAREAFLAASLRTTAGWVPQGIFWEAGPEVVKRQVLDLDLAGVAGDTVVVRLETVPAFWLVDRVAMDFTPDRPVAVHRLPLLSARDAAGRDVAPLLAAADDHDYVLSHGDAAELRLAVPPEPAGTSRTFILRTTGWYRIDSPDQGAPDVVALGALDRDPLAIARASVARLNAALARLDGGGR